ncbi:DUF1016 N-terminal domain-containing protein [uncultured Corynebacterium sp.]|uniref:DUF1016 N-terminal domain-containing protein n=1 Tax=uncultured Corynebacterium sp. TaxID=159447 RepID=UPI00345BECA1
MGQTRTYVATRANAALTMMNWRIGRLIDIEVLGSERAEYSRQIVATLGRQLTERFGKGFEAHNLQRMVKFAQLFPDKEIVVSLGPQLSWTPLQGGPSRPHRGSPRLLHRPGDRREAQRPRPARPHRSSGLRAQGDRQRPDLRQFRHPDRQLP